MSRIRVPAAVLALVLLPAGVGVVAIHASATCARFVHTYVTVPVRNRVSKATLRAWARWRVEHPDWKPNPNVHRPKYIMTRQEAVNKVDFACQLPVKPDNTDLFFTPADFEPPPTVSVPPLDTTQVVLPNPLPPQIAEFTPPPTIAGNTPPPLGPLPPLIPPPYVPPPSLIVTPPPVTPPPNIAPVPEPSSFLLLLTALGLGSIPLFRRRSLAQDTAVAAAPKL